MSSLGLLDDYVDLDAFAAELTRDPRTVRRWLNEPGGLPFTKIGNRILIHIPTARQWIAGRMRTPNPLRERPGGRPPRRIIERKPEQVA